MKRVLLMLTTTMMGCAVGAGAAAPSPDGDAGQPDDALITADVGSDAFQDPETAPDAVATPPDAGNDAPDGALADCLAAERVTLCTTDAGAGSPLNPCGLFSVASKCGTGETVDCGICGPGNACGDNIRPNQCGGRCMFRTTADLGNSPCTTPHSIIGVCGYSSPTSTTDAVGTATWGPSPGQLGCVLKSPQIGGDAWCCP